MRRHLRAPAWLAGVAVLALAACDGGSPETPADPSTDSTETGGAPTTAEAPMPAPNAAAPAPETDAKAAPADPAGDPIVAAVQANPHRSDAQAARDVYRHPVETLRFFGLEPDQTVTEQLPGWYTEILGALLAEDGHYIAVNEHPSLLPEDHPYRPGRARFVDDFDTDRPVFGERAEAATLGGPEPMIPDASVDTALVIRATHGMVYAGTLEPMLAEYFRILKPGGVLGIVQHREDPASQNTPADRRGYVKESDVIEWVTAAGFELAEKSEINANPKDTKDHPPGVWALPPVLTLGDENRDTYLAIGESDRMTLKFVKPRD